MIVFGDIILEFNMCLTREEGERFQWVLPSLGYINADNI